MLYLNHLLYHVCMYEPIVSTRKHVSFSITSCNRSSKAVGNPEQCKTEWAKNCQNFKKLTLGICVDKVHFSDLLPFFLSLPPPFFLFIEFFSKVYRQVTAEPNVQLPGRVQK